MGSFQAKIGWKRPSKREKYKLSFRFDPSYFVIENSKQIAKKFKKLEKHSYGFFSGKNWMEKVEKERK